MALLKPKGAEKISVTNTPKQGSLSLQSSKDERVVNNIAIKLRKGTIEKEGADCDVIVNSIRLQQYQEGKIAAAIYGVGGSSYEQECSSKLQGLSVNEIGCTSGNFVGCKSIYHIPFLSSDKTLTWLSNRVKDCLTKADLQGMNSIAIPTIGAGGIGLNANDVAKEMMQVALTFAQQTKMNLQEIHFIVYPSDSNSYTAFQQALINPSMEWHTQQELIETLTKSTDSNESDQGSDYQLLFKAQCTATKTPVDIHVYHGIVNEGKTDTIIDMTALCSKHATTDNHVDIADYDNIGHTSQTLRCPKLSESNHSIFQVCPYGCLAGFSTLLACINARGEKSVTIPLLDIEMNAATIECLIDLIESFIMNHLEDDNGIHCFDLVIGYQDRSAEIATWMQDKITNKPLQLKWTVVQQLSEENFGIDIYYVASNKTALANIKSNMMRCSNTWTRHEITDEEYFNTIEPKLWYQFALKIWSEYNTIIVRRDIISSSIFGYETDIMNTVSHIYNLSKVYVAEKAHKEVQQFAAETAQWYATIGSNRIKFETKLNYEIEKNYNIYCKDKTNKIVNIDSDTKIVDYESMTIKDINNDKECPIGKSIFEETAIPDNWEYNKKEDIVDGYCSLIDVQNQQEIDEISNIPELGGLTIKKLERIQNWNLYRRYQIMKAEVTEAVKKYAPNTTVERRLFHGTAGAKLDAIYKSGFDRDYSGSATGSAHGTGTYFGVKAELSRQYGDGLLLVRVLTGICTQSSGAGRPNLTIIPGSQSERVHSVVDNVTNPSMYVISNDNSAYPEYILHIEG